MVDRLTKNYLKLSAKERVWVLEIYQNVKQGRLEGLDVKPLRGHKNTIRVRKGDIRIIFARDSNGRYVPLHLERRNESTYRDF
jgi:mRNA-degrading endonuclease RelE of RelBE toxin-antitoxin system